MISEIIKVEASVISRTLPKPEAKADYPCRDLDYSGITKTEFNYFFSLYIVLWKIYKNSSPTMPWYIGDFYVTSARKFKLNNDLSCPDNKKNERHLQTVCMFCAITSLLVKFRKSWHMAFEDDTSAANTRRPFSEILPRLEPAANAISIWFIARNFWYESKVRRKISFSLARLTKKFAHGFHRNYLRRLYAKLSFKWNWWFKVVANCNFMIFSDVFSVV